MGAKSTDCRGWSKNEKRKAKKEMGRKGLREVGVQDCQREAQDRIRWKRRVPRPVVLLYINNFD